MSVASVNSQNIPVVPKGTGEKKLDQTSFITLMTAQLKQQDPFAPVDNQAMVAQMAQFSSLAGISEMNVSLKDIADQISAQTKLLTDIRAQTAALPTTPTTTTV